MAYGGFSRLHLFKALNHHEIVQNIVQRSLQFLGIDIKILKSQITLEQFEKERFGKYRQVYCVFFQFNLYLNFILLQRRSVSDFND